MTHDYINNKSVVNFITVPPKAKLPLSQQDRDTLEVIAELNEAIQDALSLKALQIVDKEVESYRDNMLEFLSRQLRESVIENKQSNIRVLQCVMS